MTRIEGGANENTDFRSIRARIVCARHKDPGCAGELGRKLVRRKLLVQGTRMSHQVTRPLLTDRDDRSMVTPQKGCGWVSQPYQQQRQKSPLEFWYTRPGLRWFGAQKEKGMQHLGSREVLLARLMA